MKLPYLTADLPGIGGQLKSTPEDFIVEEVPLYAPGGEGQHVYVWIEKRGLSTFSAVKIIARALGVSPAAIGYAGLKDAHAVTRQMLSIDGVSEADVERLALENINILQVSRHRNKIKIGHLAGNRFVIRVRNVGPEAQAVAEQILSILTRRGAPNYFGEQRFGMRNNSHRLGEALVRRDGQAFVQEYLGRPQPGDSEQLYEARRLVDEGRLAEALQIWPPPLRDEYRVLRAVVSKGAEAAVILKALPPQLKNLFISAYQSHLFNQLLAQRIATLDRLEDGDVAYIHGKGASFLVESAQTEQPRADRFEISPSGPLFGPKTLLAEKAPGRREREVLARQGLTLDDFKLPGSKVRGGRRPYRLKIKQPQVWWDEGLVVSFEL
ncbi:MAG: tRNA pseudouridine(13) synthase TruD, partial [Chloroflexi bacterium]